MAGNTNRSCNCKKNGFLFFSKVNCDQVSRANPYSYCNPNTLAWNSYLKWTHIPTSERKLWQKMVDIKIHKPQPNLLLPASIKQSQGRRYLTAYACFCQGERKKVEKDYPRYNTTQVKKELSSRWKTASQKIKNKYKLRANKNKAQYEKEKKVEAFQSDINSPNCSSQRSLDRIFPKNPFSEESLSETDSLENDLPNDYFSESTESGSTSNRHSDFSEEENTNNEFEEDEDEENEEDEYYENDDDEVEEDENDENEDENEDEVDSEDEELDTYEETSEYSSSDSEVGRKIKRI